VERERRTEEMKAKKKERLVELRRAQLEQRMAEREKETLFCCWVKQNKGTSKKSVKYRPIRVEATIVEE